MDNNLHEGLVLAGAQLRMSTRTLWRLLGDVNWATFNGTDAEFAVLRNRLVTDIAFYPPSAQEEILNSRWGRRMLMPRVAAAPAAPAGLRVQEESSDEEEDDEDEDDEEDDDEDEDEDEDEETVPVATGTTTTPDLLANTSIEHSTIPSTAQRFQVDPAASYDENDNKSDDGEGDEVTFEAQHLLAGGQYVAVAEESSSSVRLMEW
jgi:hypothetical protein